MTREACEAMVLVLAVIITVSITVANNYYGARGSASSKLSLARAYFLRHRTFDLFSSTHRGSSVSECTGWKKCSVPL